MRLLVSWLRDFVDVGAPAEAIAERLGQRGFELSAVEPFGDGDAVIDLEVTANRPDCLSILGLAREVSTIYDLPLEMPSAAPDSRIPLKTLSTGHSDRLGVTISEAQLCPRYAAAVAEVSVGTSPPWLKARLQAVGVRPISSIVDITNYVLIETGHPTHAFDLTRLAGGEIRVRRAASGESLTTLDGIQRKLDDDMLVIADRDRPQAVAGVMGGAAAEVSSSTTLVAFESAFFQPASVRRTSRKLGLKTEASFRFERGADVNAPVLALERIAALLERLSVGRIVEPIVDVYPTRREPRRIHLRRRRLASLLGVSVPDSEVERILGRLGLEAASSDDGWDVTAPTFRVDLSREVDLIEEVGRHYGFDKLDASFPVVGTPPPPPDARVPRDQLVRRVMTAAGLSEAVTFGFIEAKAAQAFPMGHGAPVALANPLSAKFDTLRPSLLPGLVDCLAHNRRHGRDDVGLFELGTRFSNAGETRAVAVAWTGLAAPPVHWSGGARRVDFFDVKGLVERLCAALDVEARFEPGDEPFLMPGQAASVVSRDGIHLGLVGQINPAIADARGLPRQDSVFVLELVLDCLDAARFPRADATQPLPRFPFVVRDLSMIVSAALPAAIIRGTIQAAGATTPAPLVKVAFFDRYQGKGVPDQAVSLSARLTFQAHDRTLTDGEVQASVDAILQALSREHGAVQR